MEGYERKHTRNLALYAKQIEDIFAEAVAEAARIGHSVSGLSDKPFSFDDYPMAKARMEALLESMHDDLLAEVENGIDAEWALANGQADELVSGMLAAAKLGKAVAPDRWLNNHAEALEAFKRRKIAGLGLSDRVWNYTGQFREEIEMALDLGIRSGKSAAEMSRDVRQYLKYPDKLFRRVRDEHGNLRLSKAAKAFHPGQGVYRSSYKNALRLTATETNIAYRTADFLRVQDLDFVVGIEVRLSNNHTLNGRPFFDICDELAGKYPKDFKFTGWHPFCRCHSIKILKTEEEFFADEQRLLAGEELGGESMNRVGDVPPRFKEWLRDNRERITKARAKGTEAYFLRDNKAYVDGILDPKPNAMQIAEKRHAARTPEQITDIKKRWLEYRRNNQKNAVNENIPHPALLKSYSTFGEIDATFKVINSEFKTEKWFEHGDLKLSSTNQRGVNGFTFMDGRISLTPGHLDGIKSALGKIGQGKYDTITEFEADAMATFWHEITHNRNIHGNMYTTRMQTDVMEMMNEFVARKTLPEFYSKLGCAETPHPQYIENRNSTGYNNRVLGYDFVIQKLGLDFEKVLQSAKKNLFSLKYTEQETTAIQALLDGGLDILKGANGKKVSKVQIKKIVSLCRNGNKTTTIENYLKQEGII